MTITLHSFRNVLSHLQRGFLLSCVLVPFGLAQTTYYVDPDGDDSRDGRSDSTAWQTVDKVNHSTFSEGNRILFKRGGTWLEALIPPNSGSAGSPIVFGSYGTSPARPILDAGEQLTGDWSRSGNVWSTTAPRHPGRLWVGDTEYGITGSQDGGSSTVSDPNTWYCDGSNNLKVYGTSGPSNVWIADGGKHALDIEGKSYLAFQGIEFKRGNSCIYMSGASHIRFDTCTICWGTSRFGVEARNASNYGTLDSCIIDRFDPITHTFPYGGQYIGGNGQDNVALGSASNWEIYGCKIADPGHSGINIGGGTSSADSCSYNVIHDNEFFARVTDYGRPLGWNAHAQTPYADHNKFFRNYVHNHPTICQLKAGDNWIYYNIFDTTRSDEVGFQHSAHFYIMDSTFSCKVFNNLFANAYGVGIQMEPKTSAMHNSVKNNLIVNCGTGSDARQHVGFWSSATDGASPADTIANNLIYPDKAIYHNWDSPIITTSTLNSSAGAGDVVQSNKTGDPLLEADTLGVGSPAVGAGTDVGLTQDYFGRTVPFGTNPDIGIHERGAWLQPLANQGKSASSSATSGNNQRKLYYESLSGTWTTSEEFESAGEVFHYKKVGETVTAKPQTEGEGLSAFPCLTRAGSDFLSVWQQVSGSDYDMMAKKSTDDGATWTSFGLHSSLSSISCSSPGPIPAVLGYSSDKKIFVFRTSTGLKFSSTTNNGSSWTNDYVEPAGSRSTTANKPSLALTTYSTWHTIYRTHLAYASDVPGGSPAIKYTWCDDFGSWQTPTDISAGIPYSNLDHANPCIAVSTESPFTVHIAWDGKDYDSPSSRAIYHRKNTGSGWGSEYYVLRYQGQEKPSITGLSSSTAWMVFPNSTGSAFYKVKHYWTGAAWVWGSQTYISSGANAQMSLGASTLTYNSTSGSGLPWTVQLASETLTKESERDPWTYARALNFIDTASGAFLSLELTPARLRGVDPEAPAVAVEFAPPSISDTIAPDAPSLLKAGFSKNFTVPEAMDTLELCYSVRGQQTAALLNQTGTNFTLVLKDALNGATLARFELGTPDENLSEARTWHLLQIPLQTVKARYPGHELRLEIGQAGLKSQGQGLLTSLGHMYSLTPPASLAKPEQAALTFALPVQYGLAQNYPNPFNPSTTIRFALPEVSTVSLAIFDVLGREVAHLARGSYGAGYHSVVWNASGVASGLYFARLEAKNSLGRSVYAGTVKLLLTR